MPGDEASPKCPERCTCERCFERYWLIAELIYLLQAVPVDKLREKIRDVRQEEHAAALPSLVEA